MWYYPGVERFYKVTGERVNMKIAELKKKLKHSRVEIRANEGTQGIMSVWFCLEVPDQYGFDYLFRIDAQCNDMTVKDINWRKAGNTHTSLYFPGYCGTYAASIKTEARFDKPYDTANIGSTFFKVIRKEIEKKNLGYVYPYCEMSQILAVLVDCFECSIAKNEINGSEERVHWLRSRREKVEEHGLENKPMLIQA